jgi:CheY-like chemotaxis protein
MLAENGAVGVVAGRGASRGSRADAVDSVEARLDAGGDRHEPTVRTGRSSGNPAALELRSGLPPNPIPLQTRACPLALPQALCEHERMAVTVLIVDDHPTFRASARRLLEREGFEVVGEAPDGKTAIALVRELAPEVVLLDIVLPDTTGFDVAEQLADPPPTVVLTSSRDRADLGPRLRSTPAAGFVSKDRLSGDAIRLLIGRVA